MQWEQTYCSVLSKYKATLSYAASFLQKTLELDHFRYALITWDGAFFLVHDTLDALQKALLTEDYLRDPILMCPEPTCIPELSISTLLLAEFQNDLAQHTHYPLLIKRETQEGIELIEVGTSNADASEINRYLTMIPLIHTMLEYISNCLLDIYNEIKDILPEHQALLAASPLNVHTNPFLSFHKKHSPPDANKLFAAEKLSRQERNCIRLYLTDLTAKEIASRLTLSHRTVENYIARAKSKLGCHTKLQLYKASKNHFSAIESIKD